MKMKWFILALVIHSWIFAFGSSQGWAGEKFRSDIMVQVNGMVCAFCAQGIEKRFSSQDAVQKIHVDLESKQIRIQLQDGKTLSDPIIRKSIEEAGFAVVQINRKSEKP